MKVNYRVDRHLNVEINVQGAKNPTKIVGLGRDGVCALKTNS